MKHTFPMHPVRSERAIRERQSFIWAALIALALLTCFAFPMALLQGCDDSDFRKAARAAAAIGTSLDEIQQLNEDAYAHSLIDRDEAVAMAKFVREAALANQHFTTSLRSYKKLNKESKAELVRLVADVARSIQALNEQGVLHIKNPSARVKFGGAIAGAIASLDILAQLIGTYEAPAARPVLNSKILPALPAESLRGAA